MRLRVKPAMTKHEQGGSVRPQGARRASGSKPVPACKAGSAPVAVPFGTAMRAGTRGLCARGVLGLEVLCPLLKLNAGGGDVSVYDAV